MVEAIATETGEVFGNPYELLNDDEILAAIEQARELAIFYTKRRQEAEYELTRRMNERSATVYVSPDWNVKLIPQVEYKYDTDYLRQLEIWLTPQEFNKVIKWEAKVSKVDLNREAKRGGEIKKIIDMAVSTVEKAPKLEIKRVGDA